MTTSPTLARPRVDRLAKAVLLALGLAVALAVIAGAGLGTSGAEGGARLGGDYPAFHAAGSIAAAGDFDELYDADRQTAEQVGLGVDGYLAFAYPPHVAVAYAPLALMGFRLGYLVHTMLMAAALLGALAAIRSMVPVVAEHFWVCAAAACTFHPLFTAIGGGQNTALTLLLLALVWRGLHDESPVLTGVAAGLLLFRPQYGIPMIGLLGLARHWRPVGVAAGVGALTWALTVPLLGLNWVTVWVEQVLPFSQRDAEVNAANSISVMGFVDAVFGTESMTRAGAVLVVIAIIGVLSVLWVRANPETLAMRMGLTAVGLLLISPHTMFYDAGVLVLVAAALLAAPVNELRPALLFGAALWVLGFVHVFAVPLGATPLAVVVLGTFLVLLPGSISTAPPTKGLVSHA
jgi:hypothetical protein